MATKKNTISKDMLISQYMSYRLEKGERPKSVYQFATTYQFTETEFYTFFGTFESIEKEIYKQFLTKTVALIQQDKNYETYDPKSKILSFYFTLFELLSTNRSYVVMSLKEHRNQLKNLMQLSSLRKEYKKFIAEIVSVNMTAQNEKIQQIRKKAIQESFWIQFLMTLKFWLEDESPSFEKTDLYIEKSLKASFEIMNIAPIDSLIDFGKFLFREKMQKNQ
jgi:hypothetical protein